MERYTLCVLVENRAGVLSKVSSLFSRRGFNIHSLSVGPTNDESISRITIEVNGDAQTVEQVSKQLGKLVDVIKIKALRDSEIVKRGIVLMKVRANAKTRTEIVELVNIFRAKIIDIAPSTVTIEITGRNRKIEAFIDLMNPYGIEEMASTGMTAMERGSNSLKLDK